MARYDEDLHENVFFQTLVGKFGGLFNEAAENRWLVRPHLKRTNTFALQEIFYFIHIID